MVKALVLGIVILLTNYSRAEATQLTLSWTDNSGGLAGATVERRLAGTSVFAVIGSVPPRTTSYVDPNVAAGSTYCYRVRAYDSTSVPPYSNESCGSPAMITISVLKAGTGTGTVTS